MARRRSRNIANTADEDAYEEWREHVLRMPVTSDSSNLTIGDRPVESQTRRTRSLLEARRRWAAPDDFSHRENER